jgi:hypothetical protein
MKQSEISLLTIGMAVFFVTICCFVSGQDCSSWEIVDPLDAGGYINGIASGDDLLVAVGVSGVIYTSDDNGLSWTMQEWGETTGVDLNAVAWGATRFVAVGLGTIIVSTDGVTWEVETPPGLEQTPLEDIIWDSDRFVAVGGSMVLLSDDGLSWTMTEVSTFYHKAVTRFGDRLVIAAEVEGPWDANTPCVVMGSPEQGWQQRWGIILHEGWVESIAASSDQIFIVGPRWYGGSYILSSRDGHTWTNLEIPVEEGQIWEVVHAEDRFYLGGYARPAGATLGWQAVVLSTVDGSDWDLQRIDNPGTITELQVHEDHLIGAGGLIARTQCQTSVQQAIPAVTCHGTVVLICLLAVAGLLALRLQRPM